MHVYWAIMKLTGWHGQKRGGGGGGGGGRRRGGGSDFDHCNNLLIRQLAKSFLLY